MSIDRDPRVRFARVRRRDHERRAIELFRAVGLAQNREPALPLGILQSGGDLRRHDAHLGTGVNERERFAGSYRAAADDHRRDALAVKCDREITHATVPGR